MTKITQPSVAVQKAAYERSKFAILVTACYVPFTSQSERFTLERMACARPLSSRSMARRFKREALTLVELLVVSALLLILASLALGSLKSLMKGQKVSQASVTVRQFIQNAQMRAVSSGRPVAVFFDRVGLRGDATTPALPVAQNFMSTRLQLGEVFPPYTGDFENSYGRLINTLGSDINLGYANALVFSPSSYNASENVTAGLGTASSSGYTAGFVSAGDILEIDECDARFRILTIGSAGSSFPTGSIIVNFGNPEVAPQLPLNGLLAFRKFRIYRQPTKSLVGSIALPRGTCVDFSLSGVGVGDSAVEGGTFGLSTSPAGSAIPSATDFSRVAIVFNSDGRVDYIIEENSMRSVRRNFLSGSSMIFLLVGRTEQVLPGFCKDSSTIVKTSLSAKLAALQHPDYGNSEVAQSNLVDSESIWVTCNPLTGEVKTSHVKSIDSATRYANIDAMLSSGTPTNISIQDLIVVSRSLAVAGLSN